MKKADERMFECEEQNAIEEFDYERAQFLFEVRRTHRNSVVRDVTNHYEEELDKYNRDCATILARKMAENQLQYENDLAKEKERLDKQISDIAEEQKDELRKLEERWKEAQAAQRKQIDTTIRALLDSAQVMAKSHRFDEAISLRDTARDTQKRERHPSIDAINTDYQNQFREALARHGSAFQEVIDEHVAFTKVLKERQNVADRTAEAENRCHTTHGVVAVMECALGDQKHPTVAAPVLRHFSPRRNKGPPPATRRAKPGHRTK
jgi:hypothetical protein